MHRSFRFTAMALVLLLGLALFGQTPTTQRMQLRGFGALEVTAQTFGAGKSRNSWITFATEDARHATLCGSKYLADQLEFGVVKTMSLKGYRATGLALDGAGYWLLGLDGAKFHVLFARSQAELTKLAKRAGATLWQPVPAQAYPRWLDCFDNASVGLWYGGGGASVKNKADFAWVKAQELPLCIQPPTESRYIAPGVLDTSITDWFAAQMKQYDLEYRALIWPGKPAWIWNRTPLPHVKAADNYLAHPDMAHAAFANVGSYEPIAVSDRYTWDFRRRIAMQYRDDPHIMGYQAAGEIPGSGILELMVVAGMPETKQAWHNYLSGVLGLDLPTAGLRYRGSREAFANWNEVSVPTPKDFLKFDNACYDLYGMWEGKPDNEKVGTEKQWFAAGAPGDWRPVHCNDAMILMYGRTANTADFWLRKTITLTAEQAKSLQYLHIGRAHWHSKLTKLFDVYINGVPLAKQDNWDQCFTVGGALKAGENRIVMNTFGAPVPSYIFLSPVGFRNYPEMDPPSDQLWFDMVNFSAWLRLRAIENILRAMRTGDPDRPIKLMAPWTMMDGVMDLCERYGAYPHETGAGGAFFAPMGGARYARTRGLPGSSEQGGPPETVAKLQQAISHYLIVGNDAADLVFAVTHYSNPTMAPWITQNRELIRCVGKMDLPTPAIGILRSTRSVRLGFGGPWNWDMARGNLQASGRTFNYLEIPDIQAGRANAYKVLIDNGTAVLTDDELDALERYVRQGGTFIALHNTGMHTPNRANAWPISRLTGLTVAQHAIPEGSSVTFTGDESLFSSLRGQTVAGTGKVLNYKNEDVTENAIGLEPAAREVEVVAVWSTVPNGQGAVAVARRPLGKGQVITLGSTFWHSAHDYLGKFEATERSDAYLHELLTALDVPRDSWNDAGVPGTDIWAEHWTSKNGVYDLYPVVRMSDRGGAEVAATIHIRRDTPVSTVWELSALGHPVRPVSYSGKAMNLGKVSLELKQSRVFAAPRADLENAPLYWIDQQARTWRALPPLEESKRPNAIPVPEDILPLIDDWQSASGQTDAAWIQPTFTPANWRNVKLGAFTVMGYPEDTVAQFRKTVTLPKAWAGKRVKLVFDAERNSWGIQTRGQLWLNGQLAPVEQPLRPNNAGGFSLDITEFAAGGELTLALEVDGRLADPKATDRGRPAGVLGAFYLQAEDQPVATIPLRGPWQAATDLNTFTPAEVGKKCTYTYLETRFTLPKRWPGTRLYLDAPTPLGVLILNNKVVAAPGWMCRLDISGLVRTDGGENVLRWAPAANGPFDIKRVYTQIVPAANLCWLP